MLLVVLVVLLSIAILIAVYRRSRANANTDRARWSTKLPQPRIVELTDCVTTTVHIELARHRFAPDASVAGRDPITAPIFGSKSKSAGRGSFGLPFFRLRRDSTPRLRFINKTGFSFDLHWHGLNTTADIDGASSQLYFGRATQIGEELTLDFPTINNNATLLWVHAHPMFMTSPFIYSGVVGLVDVVDKESRAVQRLFRYPCNRFLLVYQDIDLNANGTPTAAGLYTDESRACFGTINGITCIKWHSDDRRFVAPLMHRRSDSNLVKIDLLNGTTYFRLIHLGVCDREGHIQPFSLVQGDGGLQNPTTLTMVAIPPACRVAIVFDLTSFKGCEAFVFLYNYELSEVFEVSPAGPGTDRTQLQGLVPDLSKSSNPTPNPTPIPDPNSVNPQDDPSMLTYPTVPFIEQVNILLPNGTVPPPTSNFRIKRFLRVTLASKAKSIRYERALDTIRRVVFGDQFVRSLILQPGFEYASTNDYIALLNPRYFYNLPTRVGAPFRNFILNGDDNENSIPTNPNGSTEYIDGQNRIMEDGWNSNELDLPSAIAAYNLSPNNFRPATLPTLLFKIYPAADSENYAMLTNDTLTIEFFSSAIAYGDTSTIPTASATVVFPSTANAGQPLNIAEWVSLVNTQFAATFVVLNNISTPLSSLLGLQWSFFPWSQVLLTGQATTLKSVIMVNRNSSLFYIRFRGPWNLLQFFGKSIGAGMGMMAAMTTCSDCNCGPSCACTRTSKCSPTCTCWMKNMSLNSNIEQIFPSYATTDPNAPIVLASMDAVAELIIAPSSSFLGFPDGFQSDNLLNFAVQTNSTERWIFNNLDDQDAHPFHFHLTSAYVDPNSPDISTGLVTAQTAYWPQLYSKDVYAIGPQQRLSFFLKFANYTSAQSAVSPNVPNLGYMVHCHYASHHDMNMMVSYFTYADRDTYFEGPI
jgi:FtsP/CotA-like multicopper oxidase with cupredoxin domain